VYYLSPLRYPGGKGALAPFLGQLITLQPKRATIYVEPFAGGAGAALRLLYDEYIEQVVLNDLDPGVAALWRSVFWRTEDLVQRILRCRVTVSAWRRHRRIYTNSAEQDDFDLGFATLFLNRTNRSGILGARPIGGWTRQGVGRSTPASTGEG
jgi:DNA adenine methylase